MDSPEAAPLSGYWHVQYTAFANARKHLNLVRQLTRHVTGLQLHPQCLWSTSYRHWRRRYAYWQRTFWSVDQNTCIMFKATNPTIGFKRAWRHLLPLVFCQLPYCFMMPSPSGHILTEYILCSIPWTDFSAMLSPHLQDIENAPAGNVERLYTRWVTDSPENCPDPSTVQCPTFENGKFCPDKQPAWSAYRYTLQAATHLFPFFLHSLCSCLSDPGAFSRQVLNDLTFCLQQWASFSASNALHTTLWQPPIAPLLQSISP